MSRTASTSQILIINPNYSGCVRTNLSRVPYSVSPFVCKAKMKKSVQFTAAATPAHSLIYCVYFGQRSFGPFCLPPTSARAWTSFHQWCHLVMYHWVCYLLFAQGNIHRNTCAGAFVCGRRLWSRNLGFVYQWGMLLRTLHARFIRRWWWWRHHSVRSPVNRHICL